MRRHSKSDHSHSDSSSPQNQNVKKICLNPSDSLQVSLDNFFDKCRHDAFTIIKQTLPNKIIEFSTICQGKEGYRKRSFEEVPVNDVVSYEYLIATSPDLVIIRSELTPLKKALNESSQLATDLKLWVQLNIPRIEDGNNFGVSVQETIVQELSRAEEAGMAAFEGLGRWWQARSKLVSKIAKRSTSRHCSPIHPAPNPICVHCQFNTRDPAVYALLENDRRFLNNIWMGWSDLRNNYAILNDMITKNIEKLLNPRSENSGNMY